MTLHSGPTATLAYEVPHAGTRLRIMALVITVLGAGLVIAAAFIPWSTDTKIADFDAPKVFLFWAIEPIAIGVAAIGLGIGISRRPSRLISGILIAFGAQTILLYVGYAFVPVFGDDLGYAVKAGGFLGIVGGVLVLIGGLLSTSDENESFAVAPAMQERQSTIRTAESKPTVDAPEAGWYPDPAGQTRLRYWTGGEWSNEVRN
jgi:Protein of unknown function (DUF2510)